jgi:ribosome-associated heat shock protein Hsp15
VSDTAKLRLDKWLWQARFFKSRALAAQVVSGGHVRVNGQKVHKPATAVKPGDMLTFPQAKRIRIVELRALGTRRGPAAEAQALYADHSPPPDPKPAPGFDGAGRPDKKHRRSLEKTKWQALE